MSYNFLLDRIETRSIKEGTRPSYVIRGYASIPNMKDIYKYQKMPGGKYKSFKSLFTDNAVKSMEKQLKAKRVFIDVEHQVAANMNIRSLLDGMNQQAKEAGLDLSEASSKILDYAKNAELVFAKPSEFRIDDKGLYVEVKTNPY